MIDEDDNDDPQQEDIDRLDHSAAYCPECGAEVWDEAEFCPKCGQFIGGAALSRPLLRHEWRRKWIVLIVLAILIAFVLMFVL